MSESVIAFDLEQAVSDKSASSVEAVFENLIAAAQDTDGGTVSCQLSAKLGAKSLGDALIDALTAKLPGGKSALGAVKFFPKAV